MTCIQDPHTYLHLQLLVIVLLKLLLFLVVVRLSRRCVGGAVEPLARSRQRCTVFNAGVRIRVHMYEYSSSTAASHLLREGGSHYLVPGYLLFSLPCERRSPLLAVRLIFLLRHDAADSTYIGRSQLLTLHLTTILHHNAANMFGFTRGGDRRSSRPPAKSLVYIHGGYCWCFAVSESPHFLDAFLSRFRDTSR